MDRNHVNELLRKIDESKQVIRECTYELAHIVMQYDGSIKDALKDGLIRLNFTAPPGFYKHLHDGRDINY